MLIWKNTSNKSVNMYPSKNLISPDETFRSNGLFFDKMEIVGYDATTFEDYIQPTIKSYIVSIGNGVSSDVFLAGTNITLPEFVETERLVLAITDANDQYIAAPTDKVKIFTNIHSNTDLATAPFSYMMSPVFEYNRVKHWLNKLTIQNLTGNTMKVWVQVQRFNEFDTNQNPSIVV